MVAGHVFIATSLDGFIARADGALDWLTGAAAGSEDHGYDAFMARMDGVVMGRGTYEAVLGFGVPWPFPKSVVVLSRSLSQADLPEGLRGRVEITAETPRVLFERLAAGGWRHAYVDGGAVIRSCLAEGLIEEIILTWAPVLIGEGRPLFGGTEHDLRLRHQDTRSFPSGLVQSRYRLDREA